MNFWNVCQTEERKPPAVIWDGPALEHYTATITPPKKWKVIRWAVSSYFSNLWAAICGRRDDY